jgi:hypothetical protein
MVTESPRPSQERRSNQKQYDSVNGPLTVPTHPRAAEHIRALCNPDEARET